MIPAVDHTADNRHGDLDVPDLLGRYLPRIRAQHGQIGQLTGFDGPLLRFFEGQPCVVDGIELQRALRRNAFGRIGMVGSTVDSVEGGQRRNGAVRAPTHRDAVGDEGPDRIGALCSLGTQEARIRRYAAEVAIKGGLDSHMHAEGSCLVK